MPRAPATEEASIADLQQRIALLEQGLKQASEIREMWRKAVDELKTTKAELRDSLSKLTAAHEELEVKNASVERLYMELQEETALRERMETELRLAQKLESLGELAAGIAHEINTPIQFISDNAIYLRTAFDSFRVWLDRLEPLAGESADLEAFVAEAAQMIRSGHLTDLVEEVPDALDETLEGIDHVADIVNSLKEFAQRGSQQKSPTNVNHLLRTSVTVAGSEWKSVAVIDWQLSERLPDIYAVAAELNQVFLNIVVNAAHALADRAGQGNEGPGIIRIETSSERDGVLVKVTDNGIGMSDDIKEHIFDPFFTTRDVGEGKGQGLAIAHSIVVNHHSGKIDVESRPGLGTNIAIWLPIGTP
jgi:signal transduction histidine kinase